MVTKVKVVTLDARLSSDYGYKFACDRFTKEVVDSLPKYVKGKNKGKPKGKIEWTRIISGGYYFVERNTGNIREYEGLALNYLSNGNPIDRRRNKIISISLSDYIEKKDLDGKGLLYCSWEWKNNTKFEDATLRTFPDFCSDYESEYKHMNYKIFNQSEKDKFSKFLSGKLQEMTKALDDLDLDTLHKYNISSSELERNLYYKSDMGYKEFRDFIRASRPERHHKECIYSDYILEKYKKGEISLRQNYIHRI